MQNEQNPDASQSDREGALAERFKDKKYRDSYVATQTRAVLSRQMRNFRGELSQQQFAELLGKRQTVVSRLESPAKGGWTLRTMLEIALKLDVAVFCRFVDFPTFTKYSGDLSEEALSPASFDSCVEKEKEAPPRRSAAIEALFVEPPIAESRSGAMRGLGLSE